MALVEIDVIVQRVAPVNGAVFVVDGADVFVEKADGTAVTVWQNQAGTIAATLPLKSSNGRVNGWVESGVLLRYRAVHPSLNPAVVWEYFVGGGPPGPEGPQGPEGAAGGSITLPLNALNNGIFGDGREEGAAIQAFLNLNANQPGARYFPGRGRTYKTDQALTIPAGVGMTSDGIAAGSPSMKLLLGTAAAKLQVADGYHPEIGGFEIHGGTNAARVAQIGLHVGQAIVWNFKPITVRYTTSKAIRIERAQNCLFEHLAAYNFTGDGLCIEDGAGNNVITKYDCSSYTGGYAVAFRQTVSTPTIHVHPSYNVIMGGMIERSHENGVVAPGLIYHGAGNDNRILNASLASSVPSGPHSTIVMERIGPGVTASYLLLEQAPAFGNQAVTTAVDMRGGSVLALHRATISAHLQGIKLTDTDYVYVDDWFNAGAVTTLLVKASGTVPASSLVLRQEDYFTRRRRAAAAADITDETWVVGEAFPRRRTLASGAEVWGSGVGALDVQLGRPAAGILQLSAGLFQVLNGDLFLSTPGKGIRVKEGANAKQGTATLAAGTVTVANTSVTATSRILLTAQDNGTSGALRVSARTAGASFVITSSVAGDAGVVAYEIFEPA